MPTPTDDPLTDGRAVVDVVGGAGASDDLPAFRIGLAGGLVGILCCVGPTVLAAIGVLSATAAYDLSYDLYGNYAWWFRGAGLLVAAGLVWYALRRRDRCTLDGVRSVRRNLFTIVIVGVVTYGFLYWFTTWLGNLAVA